ncbi:MAG: hypothetical protein F2911_12385 [Actinobacteria bacterium]|uniref:Unannotated protein n=1 Tax=freshwater metagenome TaxID=449393 RepID=A0A6J7SM76_9ZZZZ|nr:hypothetical protein [Actinomycetota bacterium]
MKTPTVFDGSSVDRTFSKDTHSLSRTQFVLVCAAFSANLVFIPSVSNFVKNGTWGGGSTTMHLPDHDVSILGTSVSSYTLITGHAVAALVLAVALFSQFILARRGVRSERLVAAHRAIGPVILCTLLPAFVVLALSLSLWVIRTPFNRVMFTLLPVMIVFGVVRALVGLRRGDRALHADSMFLAFMLLESAPVFRIVMFVFARLGGQVLAPNGEPVNAGALFRTVLVLSLLALGYWSCRRLRRNLLPLGLIGLVLLGAVVFLPWSLDSAPI